MVTGGFRTYAGMNTALHSGALDIVGLARLLAIDPDAPKKLLDGRDCDEQVTPFPLESRQSTEWASWKYSGTPDN